MSGCVGAATVDTAPLRGVDRGAAPSPSVSHHQMTTMANATAAATAGPVERLAAYSCDEDAQYEEELLRDGASLKKWLQYLKAPHQQVPLPPTGPESVGSLLDGAERRNFLFERALHMLPRSYKLWKQYLDERTERLSHCLLHYRDHPERRQDAAVPLAREFVRTNAIYERALAALPMMPRLWLDYATFLMRQRRITLTRLTLDRALRALPFTLHERIWAVYLGLARALETVLPEQAATIWSRYWRVAADRADSKVAARHLACLLRCSFYDDAASLLVELAVNEPPSLVASAAADEEEIMPGHYWQELCKLLVQHGAHIKDTPVEPVLRQAIQKAMAQSNFGTLQQRREKDSGPIHATGILWNALATWHIRNGRLEEARQTYLEALRNVPTVRDFSLVFDALAKMEESVLAVELEKIRRKHKKSPEGGPPTDAAAATVEARMAAFEALIEERPFLLSDVRIRQQPNSVPVWLDRTALFREKRPFDQTVAAFEEALTSIHPRRAKGSLSQIWIAFATFLKDQGRPEEARKVFRRAIECEFAHVDDLAAVWIAYGDMELALGDLNLAIGTLAEALAPASGAKPDSVQSHIHRSILLWEHFIDLEEARGFPEAVKCAYDRVIELKIAVPQTFVNYAAFLETQGRPEDMFKVFERGIAAFGYPVAFELWNIYLPKYAAHYAARPERVRDLFEQALRGCPVKLCESIYLMYAAFEEHHGSARNCLRILERAARAVEEGERPRVFDLLLVKTRTLLGVTAQRPVYEAAIATLHPPASIEYSSRYAALETTLGEHERARAVYAHAASASDPRIHPGIWAAWQEFETAHGTENTFREMLRVKRAVQAKMSATMPFVPATIDPNRTVWQEEPSAADMAPETTSASPTRESPVRESPARESPVRESLASASPARESHAPNEDEISLEA